MAAIVQMPRQFALTILFLLLPLASTAGCKDNDCLRSCRSCEKPWPKNGSVHCPAIGFECDLDGAYPYAFVTDTGENGNDCLSLRCTGTRSLIVRGKPHAYLACFHGGWRLPGQDDEFRESTDSAVCLRKCDRMVCDSSITAKYASEGFTNAICFPSNASNTCATAACPDEALLYGGFRNNRNATPITSGVLTCTGRGEWKDENGRLFDFPACFKETCQPVTCDRASIVAGFDVLPLFMLPKRAPVAAPDECGRFAEPSMICPAGYRLMFLTTQNMQLGTNIVPDIKFSCVGGTQWHLEFTNVNNEPKMYDITNTICAGKN